MVENMSKTVVGFCVYGIGFVITMSLFVLYWLITTKTKQISLLVWTGLGLGIVWPLLLAPCCWPCTVGMFRKWLDTYGPELAHSEPPPSLYYKPDCGEQPKVVKKISPKLFGKIKDTSSCSICCDQITLRQEHVSQPDEVKNRLSDVLINDHDTCVAVCGHVFHYICLDRWFRTNNMTCPTCRVEQTMGKCYVIFQSASTQTILDSSEYSEEDLAKVTINMGDSFSPSNTKTRRLSDVLYDSNTDEDGDERKIHSAPDEKYRIPTATDSVPGTYAGITDNKDNDSLPQVYNSKVPLSSSSNNYNLDLDMLTLVSASCLNSPSSKRSQHGQRPLCRHLSCTEAIPECNLDGAPPGFSGQAAECKLSSYVEHEGQRSLMDIPILSMKYPPIRSQISVGSRQDAFHCNHI